MEKVDLRKLTPEARKKLRRVAVRLYKRGHHKGEIAKALGLRPTTVGQWVSRYEQSGLAGLNEGERGRPIGDGRTLRPDQEERIRRDIVDRTPDQLKLKFALWNAQAVRTLIARSFGIQMPARTVRKYLARWGFTPQRPLKRAYEQKPELVKKWLEERYPAIKARAQAEGAEISWGDETAVSSIAHHPRGYAPKGKTPVLVLSQAKRERLNVLSSVTNQGTVRFMLYKQTLSAEVLFRFLSRLIKEAGRKVFLILDNLRVHHSKKVRAWLDGNEEKIELFFLPSYSPELNPDEYLNCDLKPRMSAAEPVRGQEHLKDKVLSHLRSIQNQPERVKAYFMATNIQYAG